MNPSSSVKTINLSWKRFILAAIFTGIPIIGIIIFDRVIFGSLSVGSYGVAIVYVSIIAFLGYRYQAVRNQRLGKGEIIYENELSAFRQSVIGSPLVAIIWLVLTVVGLIAFAILSAI